MTKFARNKKKQKNLMMQNNKWIKILKILKLKNNQNKKKNFNKIIYHL